VQSHDRPSVRARDRDAVEGLARIILETGAANTEARAFYAGLGFEESEVTLSKAVT
jgi:ribosomal protein S18 acetylase RimI-like enzyme